MEKRKKEYMNMERGLNGWKKMDLNKMEQILNDFVFNK